MTIALVLKKGVVGEYVPGVAGLRAVGGARWRHEAEDDMNTCGHAAGRSGGVTPLTTVGLRPPSVRAAAAGSF